MYEHRIMKHVEIVLRRREIRGNDGGWIWLRYIVHMCKSNMLIKNKIKIQT
jgi:hypothetical protein